VSDMKSGLLNIVYAMRNLDQAVLDKLSICICMNPDEETGSGDSVEWIQSVADPEKGRSAITEMAQWIMAINAINVGVVSGGAGANIVPEHAQAVVDVRFWNNAEYDDVDTKLNAMAQTPFVDASRLWCQASRRKV